MQLLKTCQDKKKLLNYDIGMKIYTWMFEYVNLQRTRVNLIGLVQEKIS